MRRDYYGFAILDVRLKTLQPVSAGPLQALDCVSAFAGKISVVSFIGFERSVEFPSLVDRIEIVGRDEDLEAMRFRRLEDALHVLDRVVFPQTLVDQGPCEPFL